MKTSLPQNFSQKIKRLKNLKAWLPSLAVGIASTSLLLSVWGFKTKTLTLQGDHWDQGSHKNTFVNGNQNLQLTPKVDKVFSVKESVIWNVFQDGITTWITTGSEGKVYAFQNGKVHSQFQLQDKEITTLAKAGKALFFGSGPEGKVFRIPSPLGRKGKSEEKNLIWAETGEQFIWDLQEYGNALWLATGGEQGKIFRIPLEKSDTSDSPTKLSTKNQNLSPVLVLAEPNVLKIDFKTIQGIAYLYASVSTSGKLYRIKVEDIGKDQAKLKVLFAAGDRDVPDFTFVEEDVYLITSGSGKAINLGAVLPDGGVGDGGNMLGGLVDVSGISGISDPGVGGNGGNGEGNGNFLVKVSPDREVSFVFMFEGKSPARIVYQQPERRLYVGILEGAEIYQIDLPEKRALPQSEKIFSRPPNSISDLYLFQDRIYFTLANQGDIYRLDPEIATKGEYLSKAFDFNQAVGWGQVRVENHNLSTEVKVFTRSGSSEKPDLKEVSKSNQVNLTPVEDWSSWTEADTRIKSPPNRYLQVKLLLTSKGKKPFQIGLKSGSALIKKVDIFYGQGNAPHRIKSFKIQKLEFNPLTGMGESSQPQTLEGPFDVYNSDHSLNTVYSTEENALIPSLEPNTLSLPFPKIGRKEYVLKWEVENIDQDNLVYTILYRNITSSSPEKWYDLHTQFLRNMILLDGYKFIDGVYQFKVIAEDSLQNSQEDIYRAEAVTVLQTFDNRPPRIEDVSWENNTIRFKVKDDLSLIQSVKYSGDRRTVSLVSPRDEIYDEKDEEFQFHVDEDLTELVIIIKDAAGNIFYSNAVK